MGAVSRHLFKNIIREDSLAMLTNDYKVVEIYQYFFHQYVEEDQEYPLILVSETEVHVYSLATDSWRNLGNIAPGTNHVLFGLALCNHVVMNGLIHWLAYDSMVENLQLKRPKCASVVAFDIHKEVFEVMILPSCMVLENKISGELSGCLAALVYDYRGNVPNIDLWVMEEYGVAESWNKKFSLTISTTLHEPLALGNDGKILFVKNGKGHCALGCELIDFHDRELEELENGFIYFLWYDPSNRKDMPARTTILWSSFCFLSSDTGFG